MSKPGDDSSMKSTSSATAWSLADRHATCASGGRPETLDLDAAGTGLAVVPAGAVAADHLLGIDLDAASGCVDAWCRGGDVTAVFETLDGGRLRVTAMWRAAPPWLDHPADAWCRELVLSAQTPALETVPRIAVVADIAAASVEPVVCHAGNLEQPPPGVEPHGFLVTAPGDRAVLFLVHPLDASGATAAVSGGRARIAARLFPAAVEKGVLLRSRVIAAIGPAGTATAPGSWAATIATAFAASAPVLTT
jgi:hypothetical protein